ncbi:MAG: tRNA (N(6)-L-threonylcarbamoyladenosine(37)-C(2))-methylthiotransferase MtaB [Parachlamydiales bacterium]|jgi:threonylcarbamoyladenosine tRNA methylthiotransferase MtaB
MFKAIENTLDQKESRRSFQVFTLGCRVNQYESAKWTEELEKLGWVLAGRENGLEEASLDLVIINSCSVTEAAFKSSCRQARQLLKKQPGAKMVITGCALQSDPEFFESLGPEIRLVPNLEKEHLVELLFPASPKPAKTLGSFKGHTRAWIKVQDGCDSFCSYCIVPFTRGRSRSRSFQEVLNEVALLASNGYLEVVLTGINLGVYFSEGKKLSDLIESLALKVPALKRIRLSSLEPEAFAFDPKLEAVLAGNARAAPWLHLVLQSGSDRILNKMGRKYRAADFIRLVERLEAKRPGFTFSTDLICGFPSETEADFAKSLAVIEKLGFIKVHLFPFSLRKKTAAAKMDGLVAAKEINRRLKQAQVMAQKAAFLKRNRFLQQELEVLVEEGGEFARSANFLLVKLLSKAKKNQLFIVKIVQNTQEHLIGRIVQEKRPLGCR